MTTDEDTMTDIDDSPALTIEQVEAMLLEQFPPQPEWQPFEGDPAATWEYWMSEFDRAGEPVREDWIWERLRNRRNALLTACDFRVVPDAPWDTAPWLAYRQALRDLPDNTTDPRQAVWPVEP